MSENLTYQQLLQVLENLVENRRSGTLYIHSNCNHAITFALDQGKIYAVFFGARRGIKAIPLIGAVSGGSYRLELAGLSGVSHELPSTSEILELLSTQQNAGGGESVAASPAGSTGGISSQMKKLIGQQLKSFLGEYLGPIADTVFEDAVEEVGDFSSSPEQLKALIDKLSLDIDNPSEAVAFKQRAFVAISKILTSRSATA